MPTSNFQPIRLLDPDCCYKVTYLMANSADTDQLASSEVSWSGSTLLVKTGYIWVQQDLGLIPYLFGLNSAFLKIFSGMEKQCRP